MTARVAISDIFSIGLIVKLWTNLKRRFGVERDRWVLWASVLLGGGIALYFAWPSDPGLAPAAIGLGIAVVGAVVSGGALRMTLIGAALLAAGFLSAGLRDDLVAAPVILKKTGPLTVTGLVEQVERFEGGELRLTLSHVASDRLNADQTPERIRLRVRTKGDAVEAGNRVLLRAVLMPPPPPVAPGAFDFARRAWFERLGGVGFAVSSVKVTAEAPENAGLLDSWRLARFRDRMARRLAGEAPGSAGSVAVALMTGERGLIPEPVVEDLRAAGLAHLLAISGLHIGLMAGFVFFIVRAGLALVPAVALRFPIKKWAAVTALCTAFLYLVISGATIPTQRAFAMSAVVLVAVLFDRLAITMRLVAIVAGAMLLLTPESLLNVSFQMSFAAVVALVAVYEHARDHGWLPGRRAGVLRRAGLYLFAVGLTSLVAGLATGFFAVAHFNRFANYGLLANLLAVPVMGLWIMPWAVVAFVLMPFGLESWALEPMSAGIGVVIDIAGWVAHLPGAVSHVAAVPAISITLVSLGGLWLCLWRKGWRLWGLVPMAAGFVMAINATPPDILIDERGEIMAVRADDGSLLISNIRASAMTVETWTRRSGQAAPETWNGDAAPLTCDATGCVYRPSGGPVVALVRDPEALAEDCRRAAVVISAVPVFHRCRGPDLVVDRFDLWRNGAHAIWARDGSLRVDTVAAHQGRRPWSRYAPRQLDD